MKIHLRLFFGAMAAALSVGAILLENAYAAEPFPELSGQIADALPEPPDGMKWVLVWNDEFDGNVIDETKWEAPECPRRDGFWSKKSFALDGRGNLRMTVFQDADGKFIDGCLRTKGKFEKAKGFFVARMKVHTEVGHWSAFWLMNGCQGKIGNGSADGAEIDIMEKPWLDDRVNFAVHWDGYGKDHRSAAHEAKVPGVETGFHTYALWWSDDAYRFYIDGRQEWETQAAGICTEPLFLKLSDEIGPWAGDIKEAKLPDENLIDYVRVYDLVKK